MTVLVGQELLLIVLAVIFGALLGCALRAFLASAQGKELANRAEGLYDPAAAAANREAEKLARAAEMEEEEEANASSDAASALAAEPEVIPVKVVATLIDETPPPAAPAGETGKTSKVVDDSVDPAKVAEGMAGEGLDENAPEPAKSNQADPVSADLVSEESVVAPETKQAAPETKSQKAKMPEEKVSAAPVKSPDAAENEAKPLALDAPRGGKADDLKKIKGVGKVIEGKLNNLGIYHFEQVANWTDEQAEWVSSFLNFKGRIEREKWIEQAKALTGNMATDTAAHEDDDETTSGAVPLDILQKEALSVNVEAEEEKIEQLLAELPDDASDEEKAEAVGSKPVLLSAPRDGKADDLKQIRGIGRVLEGKLNNLGIYHFDQIANWSREETNYVSTFLSFKGRIDRENWIPQAKLLASGQATAFSIRVAKGEVESSKS
nr:hypothetical protein [uncultured Cohaesibacter sp.]